MKKSIFPNCHAATAWKNEKNTNGTGKKIVKACLFLSVAMLSLGYHGRFIYNPWKSRMSCNAAIPPSTFDIESQCLQIDPIAPALTSRLLEGVFKHISSGLYSRHSSRILSQAVQINTEVYDDFSEIDDDPKWARMAKFNDFLEESFPLVHKKGEVQLEYINKYSLVYTWPGSDKSLKPILLQAHLDTVPVAPETANEWAYPPFSGHIDKHGTVWGRGVADDKSQLLATMEAVELLLRAQFSPRRTVILAYGFDEEIGGFLGAKAIYSVLLDRYGPDGVACIIDEGVGKFDYFGGNMLMVGTGEKGILNTQVTVRMEGGHSSIPPPHTGIGVMVQLITEIENNPYAPHIDDENPFYQTLVCAAAHAPGFPALWRRSIERNDKDGLALLILNQSNLLFRALVTNAVAVTTIQGGDKINTLPETVKATINHRLNYGSKPEDIAMKELTLVKKVAEANGLQIIAYPTNATYPINSLTLEILNTLETAPVTSFHSSHFKILAGTTRYVFGQENIVTAGMPAFNTDTKWGWELSRNIFRFQPQADFDPNKENLHTVDEKQPISAHLSMVRWFYIFLRNADETRFDDEV